MIKAGVGLTLALACASWHQSVNWNKALPSSAPLVSNETLMHATLLLAENNIIRLASSPIHTRMALPQGRGHWLAASPLDGSFNMPGQFDPLFICWQLQSIHHSGQGCSKFKITHINLF